MVLIADMLDHIQWIVIEVYSMCIICTAVIVNTFPHSQGHVPNPFSRDLRVPSDFSFHQGKRRHHRPLVQRDEVIVKKILPMPAGLNDQR